MPVLHKRLLDLRGVLPAEQVDTQQNNADLLQDPEAGHPEAKPVRAKAEDKLAAAEQQAAHREAPDNPGAGT